MANKSGRPRVYVDVERARQLRARGLSYYNTAAELGVGVGTLHRALNRNCGTGNASIGTLPGRVANATTAP